MIEIELEEFESWYRDTINNRYFKVKKATKKYINDIRNSLIEVKVCMDHFIETGTDKVQEKAHRSLNFFSDRIKKEIDDIKVPADEDIYYDNVQELLGSIKKLFNSINEISRKSLPKFAKEVQPEIKELNYKTRSLGKKQQILDLFLRKKYTNPKNNVKIAEDLLKKIPKLFTLKENIERSKRDLEELENERNQLITNLEGLNNELIELEKNDFFKELDMEKDKLFKLKININDQLGFKKALKKLKFDLEKEIIHITNINLNYIRDFLKNPIGQLLAEAKGLPKFTSLMVQLRHALEENKLNLKADTKDKTIEQINMIFDQKVLQSKIDEFNAISGDISKIEDKIKEAGLSQKLEDLKNKISLNSVKLEHVQNDLDRKNKDYLRYLATLKREREEFQQALEEILGEPIKLNISFSF